MRCRVAQMWSGSGWGTIYLPRVGMEVVVQFLEGDPDRPLVVGTVYNQDNMPPYPLPGEKTKAGIRSKTEQGDGYNEFVFDDLEGDELIRLHAEKNLESEIVEDETRKVGYDRTTRIGQNDTLNVGEVLHIEAGMKIEITVGASTITLTPEKITIQSLEIEINAPHLTSTAVLSEHSAGAVMDIKGTVIKINS
jgi:type VI secretion system secreted protein VgrG